MRLPSPLAAYQRWRMRRLCHQAGITPELANELNEVGRKASEAGKEVAAILAQAISEGRDACEALHTALESSTGE